MERENVFGCFSTNHTSLRDETYDNRPVGTYGW